jgi:hypothetical protein
MVLPIKRSVQSASNPAANPGIHPLPAAIGWRFARPIRGSNVVQSDPAEPGGRAVHIPRNHRLTGESLYDNTTTKFSIRSV